MDKEQLALLLIWVEQFANATAGLKGRLAAVVQAAYAGKDFYTAADIAAAAQAATAASNTSTLQAAGLAAQYVALTTGIAVGQDLATPTLVLGALRNGADMEKVFERPMALFRRLRAQGETPEVAFNRAMMLASTLTTANIDLAQRDAYRQSYTKLADAAGITGYRRVIHPELSRSGSCGLCVVASDQVYKTDQLMPLHNLCNCTTLAVYGAKGGAGDPGSALNDNSLIALGDVYAAAGDSTHADDLKRTRFVVHDHGELGPVLTYKGQQFTGVSDLTGYAA